MSTEHRIIGVSALLTDPFIQEARSRTIWAANTCQACFSNGAKSAIIASASRTPIPFQKNPSWIKKEISRFYGVGEVEIMPTFSPNIYYKSSEESFIYDFLLPKTILPHLTDVHTRDPLLAKRAIQEGKGVIFEDHDEDVQVESRELISELSFSENFRALVCITERIKSEYLKISANDEKLVVMDSGVQNFSAAKGVIANSDAKKSFGSRPTIGYAGGLQPERDIDAIFEAAKSLPYYKFILIGGSQNLVGELVEAARLQDIHNIDFIGYLKSNDMRRVLASRCDVMLYTRAKGYNTENSSPLKLFEYLNYMKPIVSANTTVTSRYKESRGIFFYEPGSVDGLVSALESAVAFSNSSEVDKGFYQNLLEEKSWQSRQRQILEFAGILV